MLEVDSLSGRGAGNPQHSVASGCSRDSEGGTHESLATEGALPLFHSFRSSTNEGVDEQVRYGINAPF